MKKRYFSSVSKNIILISLILIAVLSAVNYHFDIHKWLRKGTSFLNNEPYNDDKKEIILDKCIDGDTFSGILDGKTIKLRLLAIDTPELKQNQLYAKEASEYTCNALTKAHKLMIDYEPGLTKTDKYHRHLVWLYVDDNLWQKKLVINGYAKVRYLYAKYRFTEQLLNLQYEAQNQKRGIWQNYMRKTYGDEEYVVVFQINGFPKSVEVKEGNIVEMIDNPKKAGYTFSGWIKDNILYDFSKPITDNVIVEAKFVK